MTPNLEYWERERRFPRRLIAEMGEASFFRQDTQASVAPGDDFLAQVALAEELGSSRATGFVMSVLAHTGMVIPLLRQLARSDATRGWLEDALAGRALLGLAATEASSGADMNAIQTVARCVSDALVIDGSKRYITNGSTADALVVLVRLEDRPPPWSGGLLLVPTDRAGITRTRLDTSGLRCGDTGEVRFEACSVPTDHLLGAPGRGFLYLLAGLQRERLLGALALNALGLEVFHRTVAFCKGRIRMGEPLIRKQAIRHRLAELEAKLEASTQFARQVAARFAQGEPVDREIWMLKVFCYEAVESLITTCAHLHGADAFLEDHWMNQALRDSQALTLAAGTSEIMRELLSAGYDPTADP